MTDNVTVSQINKLINSINESFSCHW